MLASMRRRAFLPALALALELVLGLALESLLAHRRVLVSALRPELELVSPLTLVRVQVSLVRFLPFPPLQ